VRYLDTSSLVALYYPEAKSARLIAHLHRYPLPMAFTWLHEMEFTNGFS
jgi:predicted nucleic acid-binding protein